MSDQRTPNTSNGGNQSQADDSYYDGNQSGTYGDDDYTRETNERHDQDSSHYDESHYEDEYEEEEQPEPYKDQPYVAGNDTGGAMMSYDEAAAPPDDPYDPDEDDEEEEPEYDYDPDKDAERDPMMAGEYYVGDEEEDYYDEDEEERRRRARRRRAWCCCLLLLCCLLILIILLIIFLLTLRNKDDEVTPAPTFAPFVDETDDDYYYDDDIILAPGVVTTYMAPIDEDCNFYDQEGFANVWDQCDCDGEISIVPGDVSQMRDLIIDRMFSKFYDENRTIPINSCDPVNMALIWLASGDNRDSGEPRQRLGLAIAYYGLNGTIWDYDDEWMGELNECLWLGVQCNNRDTVNSLAVDTNNIFGPVSAFVLVLYFACWARPLNRESFRAHDLLVVAHCLFSPLLHPCSLNGTGTNGDFGDEWIGSCFHFPYSFNWNHP